MIWVVLAAFLWTGGAYGPGAEAQLARATNDARVEAGVRALHLDPALVSVARWRSRDMIVRDYYSHHIPGDGTVLDELRRRRYCYIVAGENITWNNYPDDLAARQAASAFLGSPGHRANMLDRRFDAMGVGAFKGPTGKKMFVIVFADHCTIPPTDTE